MHLDWDSLGKLDVIFGIVGGIVLIFSMLRWIAQHLKSSYVPKLLAWAIIGDEDEKALIASLIGWTKLTFAATIWAIIGAVIGVILVSTLTLVTLGIGSEVIGTRNAIVQNAFLGAIIGAIFRAIIWPIFSIAQRHWVKRKQTYKARYKNFLNQKQRVDSKIKKGKKQ